MYVFLKVFQLVPISVATNEVEKNLFRLLASTETIVSYIQVGLIECTLDS